ncbi:MAG: alpha/beta hydrolase [Anaerolineae bacterium]|jgi:acetyl esterase/lipase|nr:alpha/beta hydrolase [Anaerolineae bacterium]
MRTKLSLVVVLVGVLSGVWASAQPDPSRLSDYQPTEADLAYDTRFRRQVLDVYLPTSDARTTPDGVPLVFAIHGGGYVTGDKDIMAAIAEVLTADGYAVVSPNYRLGTFPDPIDDITCALAWALTEGAQAYAFDLSRVVITGESAGGNAAALLSAHDDLGRFLTDCPHALPDGFAFAAAVPYYLYGDMTTCTDNCRLLRQVTGVYLDTPIGTATADQLREAWGEASPLVWIDGSEPPTLAIHGRIDDIVPYSETELYVQVLTEAGAPIEAYYLDDAPHGYIKHPDHPAAQESAAEVVRFLGALWEAQAEAEQP